MNGEANDPSHRPKGRNWQRNRRRNKAQNNEKPQNGGQNSEKTKDMGEQAQKFGGRKQDKKEKRIKLVPELVLKDLPTPGPHHIVALTKLINTISTDYGMSKEDLDLRWQVFNDIKSLCEQEFEGCSLRLFGSSKSGLGLKTSDINIYLDEENEEKIPKIFLGFLNTLKGCEKVCEVKEEFETNWPMINFKDVTSGLTCRVSAGNNLAFLTNSLLQIYGELDSRVKPLCHCFRLWGKICEVDRQAAGTLPPYSLFLMVIHYLQQIEPPVLPVIHEQYSDELTKYFEEEDYDLLTRVKNIWKTRNKSSLGELWLGLLRFYSDYEKNDTCIVNIRQKKVLKKSEKSWGKQQKLSIEDPFSTKRNVARTILKTNAYRYIIEHLRVALVYFSHHPNSADSRLRQSKVPVQDQLKDEKNIQKGNASKHKNGDQNSSEKDVDVAGNDSGEDETEDKDGEVGDKDGKVGDKVDEARDEYDAGNKVHDQGSENEELIDGIFAMDTINDSYLSDNDDADTTVTDQSILEEDTSGPYEIAETTANIIPKIANEVSPQSSTPSEQCDIHWENAEFGFNDSVLRKGDGLETKCTHCGEKDHIVDNCTAEQFTSKLKPLPPVPDWFKDILTDVCYQCKHDFGITQAEVNRRKFYLNALETYIRQYLPDAKLHLFGSSCNGFGFSGSDMDLCMTLKGKKKSDIDCVDYITKLASILRKNSECSNILAITGAKVPIVKFILKHANVEADISMYNEVALWNTSLLRTYVDIDSRVHVLGCTLKIFVKLCDIGDASKGSLSSYAYILMLLHFLQQRQPPVIPVLQELYDTPDQPKNIIEGHNCWFYNDPKKLHTKWTARNTESCGELWLGFLRYYTEEFDYRRNVVCVRYLKPLTKFEKLWNGRQICIEDPFVLSHNLAAALSLGMVKFIRSTFERAREHFGTTRRNIPVVIKQRQRSFFDVQILTNGLLPPTGRNCNVCGKIGHWAKECPFNKSRREKKQQNKEDKAQQNNQGKNQQNKDDKGRQNKDEKMTDEKTTQNKGEKNSQSKVETRKQSGVETLQNKEEITSLNLISNSGKTEEDKREESEKNNIEDTPKVTQNPVLVDRIADDASKLGNPLNDQSLTLGAQPLQTVVSPLLLPQHGQIPQQHVRKVAVKYPPRMFKYQPLSPPISPGNPLSLTSPIQPPSPMSIPLSPGPLMGTFPRGPFRHLDVHVSMSPVSPPNYHTSPGTPGSPHFIAHPANRIPVNHHPMFREFPSPINPATGPLPQPGPIHSGQVSGSPNNPFQFSTFIGDYSQFVNNSPASFGSPPRLLQQGPGSSPVARNDLSNHSPRVFSCEELERAGRPTELPQGGEVHGSARAPTCESSSLGTTDKTMNTDAQPSVLEGLRLLKMNEAYSPAQRNGQNESVCFVKPETNSVIAPCNVSVDRDFQDFKLPPNVENVAIATMITSVTKLQQGPSCPPVIINDISDQSPRVVSCKELEGAAGPFEFPPRDQADGFPRTRNCEGSSLRATEQALNTDTQPSVLEGLRLLKMNETHSSAQRTGQNDTVPSVKQEANSVIAPCIVSSSKGITSNETQDFNPSPKIEDVAVTTMTKPNMGDSATNQGEGVVFTAEYSEGKSGKRSRNRRRKNKLKQERGQDVQTKKPMTENISTEHFPTSVPSQQKIKGSKVNEQEKPNSPPQADKVNEERETKSSSQADREEERNTNVEQSERDSTKSIREYKKPREVRRRYRNQRKLAPTFPEQLGTPVQNQKLQQQQQKQIVPQEKISDELNNKKSPKRKEKQPQLEQQPQQKQPPQQQQEKGQQQQQEQQQKREQQQKQQQTVTKEQQLNQQRTKQRQKQEQPQRRHDNQEGLQNVHITATNSHMSPPSKGKEVSASHNEKMSTKVTQDQLIVKLNGEQRQVNIKSPNKNSDENSNENAGRKKRRRRRKSDNTS